MRKIVELQNEEIQNVVGGVQTAAALSTTNTVFQSPLNATMSTAVAKPGSFQMWNFSAAIKR